jgi:LPS export ABC transporter protein LptC
LTTPSINKKYEIRSQRARHGGFSRLWERALGVIIILVLISLTGCENKFEPPKTHYKTEDLPTQESWNTSVAFSDSGNIKAVLKAHHIAVYNEKQYTDVDSGAIVDFYKNGIVVSTLSAKRGRVIDSTKNIEMYDSVVVVSTDGSVLKTEKLHWDNKQQKVSSDVAVKIKTPAESIEGIGFESDQGLKNYKIFKVTGTFK